MPTGKFNSLDRIGTVVEDPKIVVWLDDNPDKKFGTYGNHGLQDTADYLLYRVCGITLGDLTDYYNENDRPIVCAEVEGEGEKKWEWDVEKEQYVELN